MMTGSMVALVTPMNASGALDKSALQSLVEWHITEGTDAIIVAGTTGESVTLHHDEQYEVIAFVVNQVKGRIPVIAGTGTNSTAATIKLTENAKKAGVDACLIVTPYYNKPPQKGLYEHYKTIADATKVPLILYNVPSRTACDILPETVEQLAKISNIIGIKEATGKVARTEEILSRCPPDFVVYSGDDATGLDLMLAGAKGIISVTANIVPRQMNAMCHAALKGEVELAKKINTRLSHLHQQLFIESNPIPTKWALQQMGKIKSGIRLPLVPLDVKYHDKILEAMKQAGVESECVQQP